MILRVSAALLTAVLIVIPAAVPVHAAPASNPQAAYARLASWYNPRLTWGQAYWVAGEVIRWSRAFGVPVQLVAAVIAAESSFRHNAVSSRGAIGFGQLMPGTAARMGLNPRDPVHNIYGTTRKLRELLVYYRGRLDLTLAAYNAGTDAVARYRGVPPYHETRNYVATVITLYRYLASQPAWQISLMGTAIA